jgi:c-di-GMP-binding flagellar brake protein YcgR
MNTASEHRIGHRVSVDILLNKYVKGRPYLCRATNVSRHGLLVHRIREPENDESYVGLQFQLPGDDRVITCAGQIVHEHNWVDACGVRFTAVAPEHQDIIDSFLESQGVA